MDADVDMLPPRYRNARLIGRGGMGEIYLATDEALGREVAVKLLSEGFAQEADVRERFKREALAAARLSGEPGAVTIFDVGEHRGRPFIVMEHVPGGSLADRLRGGRPPLGDALGWLEEAGRTLDIAHGHGIVHRDVKPGNLLLDASGNVHVADFGVASAAGLASLTRTGTVLGTAGYLSPEQARGERATPASDRYALAVLAWEMLTGERPYASETPTAEAAAHASAPVPLISERTSDLPADLDAVFCRALSKEPDERYPTCLELVEAIRGALARGAATTDRFAVAAGGPRTAATRAADAADPPPTRRRSLAWPLALAALAALTVGGIALAASIGGGDGDTAETLVTTVETTLPGTTVERPVTVTKEAPAPPPPPAPQPEPQPQPEPPPSSGGTVSEARQLTDESTALMREGDYEGALALAQDALAILDGTGDTYEGYANFNVGNSLANLRRCDEAIPYLERRRALLGPHPDVDAALRRCGVGGSGGGGDD